MSLWIFCGVAGSGKSSVARRVAEKHAWKFLDADDFHPASNLDKMRSGLPLTERDREPWLLALEKAVSESRDSERVLAFPGLKASHRERLKKAAGRVHLAFLRISLETARKRLAQRGGFFLPEMIESQFKDLEVPSEAFVLDAEASELSLEAQAESWIASKIA
jgi:gluconokinase